MRPALALFTFVAALAHPLPARAQATTWTIDAGHSAAQFSVRHMVVSNVKGQFDGPTGTVAFDPANIPGTLRVEASLDARTINTRNPDRDKDLRGSMFFDVERFPRITFTSKRAEGAAGHFKVTGDLTMHGVTKEVVLDVEGPTTEVKDIWGNRRAGATASTVLDRRDFGLLYSSLLEGGGAVVGNDVTISIDLEITHELAKE
jgi:polyisoprenoid-binding protein YceI